MLAVLGVIDIILNLAVFVLIAQAILSWLIAFGVVNSSNQFVSTVLQITHQLTEPALRPIRRRLPPMNGLDLSPLILILGIYFVRLLIAYYVMPAVIRMGI